MANQFIKIPCFDSTCQTSNTYWILLVCIDAKKDLQCHVGNHQLSAVLCHDPWADLMPPKAKPDLGFVKNRIGLPCWFPKIVFAVRSQNFQILSLGLYQLYPTVS